MPSLYDEEILHFRIYHDFPQRLTTENLYGAKWSTRDFEDPLYTRIFVNLKLKSIRISIDCFEGGNLAQLIRLEQNVRIRVRLLERISALPLVEIPLLDTECAKWANEDGNPRDSFVPGVNHYFPGEYDVITVIRPLCRLRKIPRVCIHTPKTFTWAASILDDVKPAMERQMPFGSFTKPDPEDADIWGLWDDRIIQKNLDEKFVAFENILDDLPGQTADMMRLERFASWYSNKGESEHLNEWKRMALERQDTTRWLDLDYLERRQDFLVSYNPCSVGMQKLRLQLEVPSSLRWRYFQPRTCWNFHDAILYCQEVRNFHSLSKDDEDAKNLLKSCWSKAEWRKYYPEGIPPLELGSEAIFLQTTLGEYRRHEEGKRKAEWPNGFARIQAQADLIDFRAGGGMGIGFDNLTEIYNNSLPAKSSCRAWVVVGKKSGEG